MVEPLVTSTANRRVREIRALRQRKHREHAGLCYVEGIRAVGEALGSGASIETLVVSPELLTSDFARGLVRRARAQRVSILEVSPAVFASLSERDGPQGLAAAVRQRWERLDAIAVAPGETWVAVDGIADPGNLGTILRTCDASGAAGAVVLGDATDPYDPAAVRASMGAVFTRRLSRASFRELVDWVRATGARLVGSAEGGGHDYRDADYGEATVLLLGSEREGLSAAQREACDELVRIPMLGTASSLNVAVAAGVLLYEVLRRRERRADA
ncbi:MAG: RNA methyltransferase [Chloroflexi bacterium]|nr:RNA methyltransferase [Chloroflexota bacterium]